MFCHFKIDEEVAKLLALKAQVETDTEKSGRKRILKQPKVNFSHFCIFRFDCNGIGG